MLRSQAGKIHFSVKRRALAKRRKKARELARVFRFGEGRHFRYAKAFSDYFAMLTRIGIGAAIGTALWLEAANGTFPLQNYTASLVIWAFVVAMSGSFFLSATIDIITVLEMRAWRFHEEWHRLVVQPLMTVLLVTIIFVAISATREFAR